MRSSVETPITSIPSTSAASGALAQGTISREMPGGPSAQRRPKGTAHRPQLPAERELTAERAVLERLTGHLATRREHADRDREVESRSCLPQVGGREVHRQPLQRELEPGVQKRCAGALARLPDSTVRQTNQREG